MSVQLLPKKLKDLNAALIDQFLSCRIFSVNLCENLTAEDCQIQSMEDSSPIKWHLAHTTWAVEVFFLAHYVDEYTNFNDSYIQLFNSYYNGVGKQHLRRNRGLLSNPSFDEVIGYRKEIENRLIGFLNTHSLSVEQIDVLQLVIQHEKQHQELMMMDIKHAFFHNPLLKNINNKVNVKPPKLKPIHFIEYTPELTSIGVDQQSKNLKSDQTPYLFSFDNERPTHKVYIAPFKLADRLVSNEEYLEFINAAGYQNSFNWLSDGWAYINKNNLTCPMYWFQEDSKWFVYTLQGKQPLDLNQVVCHVSFYEAQAYATWRKMRLPTEFEWEFASHSNKCKQMIGKLWQWTSSSYSAYPGFKPYTGKVSEYNGKFMLNQYVLRGGCVVSPDNHIRNTYRNFYYPYQSWMFSSIRLAQDLL